MALWQMKTLIRDGRVSILFFFNPYPGAFAGPPCLCLCAKKFPASLCNKILFWERSNKPTMWAHHSRGDPATSLTQNKELGLGPRGWVTWIGRSFEVLGQVGSYTAPRPPPCETLKSMLRLHMKFRKVPKENRSVNKMQSN